MLIDALDPGIRVGSQRGRCKTPKQWYEVIVSASKRDGIQSPGMVRRRELFERTLIVCLLPDQPIATWGDVLPFRQKGIEARKIGIG